MKKLVYLLVAVSLVLALVPTVALAHTEDDPLVVNLLAGQTEDIGDVKVWNDAETLYVQFVSTGDCLLETHVAVATSLADIPQTKKGNPIPGQFEYSDPHGCVNDYTYEIPLTWGVGTELYIAAHAALGREEAMAIVSGDGQTMVTQRRSGNAAGFTPLGQAAVLAWEPGPNYPNDGPDDSAWEAWSLWDRRLSTNLVPTGADWIWESYRVQDPVYGTVLTFQRDFDIGYPIGGNLLIACDNGYQVFLNGTSLGSDNVYGDWRTSNLMQAFVDVDGWDAVGSYSLLDYLLDGANTLTVDAANEYFNPPDKSNSDPGTQSSNPGACIFAMDVDYYADGETAWGCGNDPAEPNCDDFEGKNWATYFTYTVQEICTNVPEVVNGSFEVPAVAHSSGWEIYDSGTTGLGWTVEWYDGSTSYGGQTRPGTAHLELHKNGNLPNTSEIPDGWQAKDGSQYAELDTDWNGHSGSLNNEPASVKIYQDLQTCPGQEYMLKFSWAHRPDSRVSKLKVFWNGAQVGSEFTGSGGSSTIWHDETFTVSATGETTTLEFVETGTPDSYGMFLDDVSVTESP